MIEEAKVSASKKTFIDSQLKPKDLRGKTTLFHPLSPHALERLPLVEGDGVSELALYGEDAPKNPAHMESATAWADSFNASLRRGLARQRFRVKIFSFDSLAADISPVPEDHLVRGTVTGKDTAIPFEAPTREFAALKGAPSADFVLYISKIRVYSKTSQAYETVCGAQCYSYKVKGRKETDLEFEFYYTLWDYNNNRVAAAGFYKEFGLLSDKHPLSTAMGLRFARRITDLVPPLWLPEPAPGL